MRRSTISDVAVLAAIDRAFRHRGGDVPMWMVCEHLGISRRSRRVRERLQSLCEVGVLARSRTDGIELWSLTAPGRRLLEGAAGVELPESPQHRAWRQAHTLAEQEIGTFRIAVREAVADTGHLLDEGALSDTWFELAQRLRQTTWRLGSATYCLHEWAEPSDQQPDLDDGSNTTDQQLDRLEREQRRHRRIGRLNTHLWSDPTR